MCYDNIDIKKFQFVTNRVYQNGTDMALKSFFQLICDLINFVVLFSEQWSGCCGSARESQGSYLQNYHQYSIDWCNLQGTVKFRWGKPNKWEGYLLY